MPKAVESYFAMLTSATSTGVKSDEEWGWREVFVGLWGTLTVYESETEPEKHFCLIIGWDGYLRTGKGVITRGENELTISTKNSVYTFLLRDKKPRRFDNDEVN